MPSARRVWFRSLTNAARLAATLVLCTACSTYARTDQVPRRGRNTIIAWPDSAPVTFLRVGSDTVRTVTAIRGRVISVRGDTVQLEIADSWRERREVRTIGALVPMSSGTPAIHEQRFSPRKTLALVAVSTGVVASYAIAMVDAFSW